MAAAYAPTAPEPLAAELYRRLWADGKATSLAVAGLLALVGLLFANTFRHLLGEWESSPDNSHGYLVIPFAVYLLWARRESCPAGPHRAAVGLGLGVLFAGVAMKLAGGVIQFDWLEGMAIIPVLLGLALAFGGWKLCRWAAPAVLFLAFMVPLPYAAQVAMSFPLQRFATICSTFVMQTLGLPALQEGNTILIREVKLGIVEACSGLRMLVTFFTFSTAVCLVVKKPLSDKLCIVLSAVPIALAVNVLRIVITGVMYLHVSGESAKLFFHDLAGWFMMPAALAFLWAELWVLKRLIIELPSRPAYRPA